MAKYKNQFARVDTVLVAAVNDSGTFTVSYPSGTSQDTQWVVGNAYMIVNDNDRWTAAGSKMSASFGASTITVTNSTGATLPTGSRISLFFDKLDGTEKTFTFYVDLASITAADVLTDFMPRVDGDIVYFGFEVDKAVTTAAKAATFNMEIGTTDLTGGAIALTSANATPKGKIVAGSAITGNNTVTRDSKISIEASSVTAFSEGTGSLVFVIRENLPDAY